MTGKSKPSRKKKMNKEDQKIESKRSIPQSDKIDPAKEKMVDEILKKMDKAARGQ